MHFNSSFTGNGKASLLVCKLYSPTGAHTWKGSAWPNGVLLLLSAVLVIFYQEVPHFHFAPEFADDVAYSGGDDIFLHNF